MNLRHLLLLALLLPAALLAQPAPIAVKSPWGFVPGSEFPGARGSVATQTDADENIVLLNFDFTEGGVYVGARALVLIDDKAGELRLRVRTGSPQKIGIRLRDARGQWHQNEFAYENAGEWSPIRWDLADFRSKLHWGGPKDGLLHLPVQEVQILLNKSTAGSPSGTLEFRPPQFLR